MQLSTHNLSIGYKTTKEQRIIGSDLFLELPTGRLTALLGPNGSGKSTLIKTLCNLIPVTSGTVFLEGKPLSEWSAAEISRCVSVVLQDSARLTNLTVFEVVALGRTPHTNWLGVLNREDKKMVSLSLEKVGILSLAHRQITELSGGEWQKVMLAKALAQDTPIILLDEPTSHLDLLSKIELVRLLRKTASDDHKAILFSTHDLELALKSADFLWLMDGKGKLLPGIPEDLVLEGHIQKIYSHSGAGFDPETGEIQIPASPSNKTVSVSGTGKAAVWTRKALRRTGFREVPADTRIQIIVENSTQGTAWIVTVDGRESKFRSIGEMLQALK